MDSNISIKSKQYVKYHRVNYLNYYNEIYTYIIDNNKIPDRIINQKNLTKKKYEFKKMNVIIIEKKMIDRLEIKYYSAKSNNFSWKKYHMKMK